MGIKSAKDGSAPSTPSSEADAGWESLAQLLTIRCSQRPDAVAAYDPDGRVATWSTLAGEARGVSTQLKHHGVHPGRRVGVLLPNHSRFASALFGAWGAGAIAVVISALNSPAETEQLCRAADVQALITQPGQEDLIEGLPTVVPGDIRSDPSGSEAFAPEHRPLDALVVFTSGTTGTPKGIVHGGGAIVRSLQAMALSSGLEGIAPRSLGSEDRSPNLALTPLSHMSGLLGVLFTWWAGKPIAIMERFSPEQVDEAVRRYSIRTLRLVPTMVYDLVRSSARVHLPGVSYATVGTAALSPALAARFEERFGFPILANYGQSEALGGVSAEGLADIRAGRRPPGSVGRPLPGVSVHIVDPHTGRDVPGGDIGEIAVKSAQVMKSYVSGDHVPLDDRGLLRTGDLGRLDGNGILSVVGRSKSLIVCGGFNVYPGEVEAVIGEAPGIEDVAVVGISDERLGEVPVAVVVAGLGGFDPSALDTRARETLAPYKRPRAYLAVTAIPKTASGKTDLVALGELLGQRSGELERI
ncbi:MAG TPA: class I adenylate-forming enzyme family protein [Acidimicrobiales bacterium]|nr:class I adenylate-forming enzyme family protein [Acidimicrobiales bacterium]